MNMQIKRLIELAAIDLGSDPRALGDCGPSCAKPARERFYPTLYIHSSPADISGIPDEGEAKVKYKVRSRTVRTSDGKKEHSADIEIRSIDAGDAPKLADGAKPLKRLSALDRLVELAAKP